MTKTVPLRQFDYDTLPPKSANALRSAAAEILVAANGCFDLLHVGHLRLLEWARGRGDKLFVLVNSDDSVRRLKGRGRPLVDGRTRCELLAALGCVDYVVEFAADAPARELERLSPHVLVKGAEYQGLRVEGADFCGRVEFAPMTAGCSTTGQLERVWQQLAEQKFFREAD